jgi:prolyl 4-hydroxylase
LQPSQYQDLCHIAITKNEKARCIALEPMQLYCIDDLVNKQECQALTQIINQHLAPSIIDIKGNTSNFRTSSTCYLGRMKAGIISVIDQRISDVLGIGTEYGEVSQAQQYQVGQEFKPHHDFFHPGTQAHKDSVLSTGQRTWTAMVYIQNTEQGGGTRFLKLDKTFPPKMGQALFWNNLNTDGSPNLSTLHQGCPVEKGTKLIITKWFRERPIDSAKGF